VSTPGPREIADLLAWARDLSGRHPIEPGQLAAYLRAKHALLARIRDHEAHQAHEEGE